MEKIDLVVWDLETSGLKAPESKVLEIGAFIINDGKVSQKRWVLQNNIDIPEKITEINGFTREMIDAEGVDPEAALSEFLYILTHAEKNITHNGIRFDIPFLFDYAASIMAHTPEEMAEMRKYVEDHAEDTKVLYKAEKQLMEKLQEESFAQFAARVEAGAQFMKCNLALCADEYRIDRTGIEAHRALGDVKVTYMLYCLMNHQLIIAEGGVITSEVLEEAMKPGGIVQTPSSVAEAVQPIAQSHRGWQKKFLDAGTANGLGDLSMMIGTVAEIIRDEVEKATDVPF